MFSTGYYIRTYGWFYALVKRPFESLVTVPIERLTNIFRWIPVLWKDRNWNGSYDIFRILNFKLSQVEECLRGDTWHEQKGVKERVKEVVEARNCLKRMMKDDYCKREQIEHDKKHGKLKMSDDGVGSYSKDGKILTRKLKFTPDSSAARKSRMRIWNLEEKRKKEDFDKFCEILKKSGGWWT